MIKELRFRVLKNTTIFCLFFVLITTYLYAQEKKGFRGGVMIGAVASQVDGDRLQGYHKGGLQAGIYLTNKFNSKTGFTVEMKYIQKGSRSLFKIDSLTPVSNDYYKLRLSYVEVPFLFNFYLKKKFMIEGGLGFAYLFRVRQDIGGFGMTTIGKYERQFNKFEIPFVFGVAFYPIENFHIDFRTSYSILPIREHPANQTFYFDRGQYNNLISFGMFLNI